MSVPDEHKASYLVGRHPVREALEEGGTRIEKVWVLKGAGSRPIHEIQRAARAAGVQVQMVPSQKLDRMVPGLNHQGVVALVATIDYLDVDEMLNGIAPHIDEVRAAKPLVLVLDRIEDPYNFGAILRGAVAAGVGGVIVPQRHMAPLNAAAFKASAGTARHMPVARTHNLREAIQQLKERGYWVAGASGTGEVTLWEMDWDRPIALVMGNEERGLRDGVQNACDYRVRIPMRGPAESLNVAMATGILLFAATRGRP
jgi:23S rRNA (guanosine2251-2'-O)-methyltransferase